jgi:hypothetical protein
MGPLHTALDRPSTRLEEWSLIGSGVDCELNSVKACACGSSAIGLVLMLMENVATRRVENTWKAVIGGLCRKYTSARLARAELTIVNACVVVWPDKCFWGRIPPYR